MFMTSRLLEGKENANINRQVVFYCHVKPYNNFVIVKYI